MILKQSLPWFFDLVKKSDYILESIMPKSIQSKSQLSAYLNLPKISNNIQIDGQIPLESLNRGILNPAWDMLNRGGKKFRPVTGLIASSIFINDLENIEKYKELYQLIYITDIFHNASLIIDDIEDRSIMRRGKKCSYLIFGEDICINAGFSMFIFPLNHFISKMKDPIVKGIIAENYFNELSALHLGQGWDIEMKCKTVPNIQSYIDTVLCKTGVGPRLTLKMVREYINHFLKINTVKLFDEILSLGDDLSIAFQIWDDLMNLRPSKVSKSKNVIGEDITEGKLTIMVLHTLNGNYKSRKRLKEILQMNTKDQNVINEGIQILKDNGSIDYSEKVKNDYIKKFKDKCNNLINKEEYKKFNISALNQLIDLQNYLIQI